MFPGWKLPVTITTARHDDVINYDTCFFTSASKLIFKFQFNKAKGLFKLSLVNGSISSFELTLYDIASAQFEQTLTNTNAKEQFNDLSILGSRKNNGI